jgi:hypothetical protein
MKTLNFFCLTKVKSKVHKGPLYFHTLGKGFVLGLELGLEPGLVLVLVRVRVRDSVRVRVEVGVGFKTTVG